jgi:adenine-specific DNA-methyltransferase
MYTPYHSKYWAAALTCKGAAGSIDSLSRSLAGAKVDLNPHQVDAALFAIRSPLSKGVLLADEVGLGKTIEAGLVLSQTWAERRRRLLVIVPATLRKQWQQELLEKFALPSIILESQTHNAARRAGNPNPFEPRDQVVICSYHFAAARSAEVQAVKWDLVVIDEAHRLRNIYKRTNKIASAVAEGIGNSPKILMTATPLQNSLMELYGLVSVIDPQVFGDLFSFREQFLKNGNEADRNYDLKERLKPVCTRTLRKQVLEYIRFTQRIPLTQDFLPSDDEQHLYDLVSSYLQRNILFALPASQRSLLTLVLRKLLASSTFAIAGTLHSLIHRLQAKDAAESALTEEDFEAIDELADEWEGEDTARFDLEHSPDLLRKELEELQRYAGLADAIKRNSKGDALLSVLETALGKAVALGAARKAVIFTESRRTQRYLFELLGRAGYAGQIVLINGTNADPGSKAIYEAWVKRHRGTDAVSGSRSADTKAAIVQEFRDRATVLIATESAAEGVNLQFCSLVVNYDLPWNPQRIEQRIGRCHRYGQQHDVVVVNFLNRRNAADQRVFQLLAQKFRLFDGVFGASDEVLGALESGVDLEKRIAQVYQECRTADEIQAAFDRLQAELDTQINARMADTRRNLLENFDYEVHERLKAYKDQTFTVLSDRQRWLADLARQELGAAATFFDGWNRFSFSGLPSLDATQGVYNLDWRDAESRNETFFRLEHPLAQSLVGSAFARELPPAAVRFSYGAFGQQIGLLRDKIGWSGWLEVSRLTISSFQTEEFILLAGVTGSGECPHADFWKKLLLLPGSADQTGCGDLPDGLAAARENCLTDRLAEVSERNGKHFDEEVVKLDRWSEDLKLGLEQEIKELDRSIRDARRQSVTAIRLEDKLEAQKTIKALESARNNKRRELFAAQDRIDAQRDELISRIEEQMHQRHEITPFFTIRWTLGE